jgi:hypothetical protein
MMLGRSRAPAAGGGVIIETTRFAETAKRNGDARCLGTVGMLASAASPLSGDKDGSP